MLRTIICCILSFQLLTVVAQRNVISELVVLNIKNGKQKVILSQQRHFEAPNWSRNGKYLLFNSGGKLETITPRGKKLRSLNTGAAANCNNDHGFSFDGKTLIISHSQSGKGSQIFHLPAGGGEPVLITPNHPSYWHGISPDGQFVVYCAQRNNEWDVFQIHINGGEEKRLTSAPGLDDGPEYSYDGQWIYFNSHRTGRMHLYRMKPDGTNQEQLSFDEYDNWFPHPSPNGKTLAYIAYLEDQKGQHPFGKNVKLRLFDLETRRSQDITPVFYGGQGSLNVASWSPNGKKLAFVKYREVEK